MKLVFFARYLVLAAASFLALNLLLRTAEGVRYGDRHWMHEAAGDWYAFGEEISIIDQYTGEVKKTLEGATSWGDLVYIRDLAQIRHYIFANNRETDQLWVIDTDEKEIVAQIDLGERPVHIYGIESREEIWSHLDSDGDFDIVHLSDVQYLKYDSLKAHMHVPGHGKLLFDPNLGDTAYATNTAEPYLYQLNLEEKTLDAGLLLNSSIDSSGYSCARTHGIAFSPTNMHLYIECSDPSDCTSSDYTNATVCSGSVWEIDTETFTAVNRLVSDALNDDLGGFFGMKGQTYSDPSETHIVVTNKKNNYLHFLKPVDDDDTETFEVSVQYNPGAVVFYPKDGTSWGPDTSFEDYLIFIALEDSDDNSGVLYIDAQDVSDAWYGQSDDVPINYIGVGAGNYYRPLARGGGHIVTPTDYQSSSGYTSLSFINASSLEEDFKIPVAAGKTIYAPYHTDELSYQVDLNAEAIEEATVQLLAEIEANSQSEIALALSVGAAGLGIGLSGLVMSLVVLCLLCRGQKQTKRQLKEEESFANYERGMDKSSGVTVMDGANV